MTTEKFEFTIKTRSPDPPRKPVNLSRLAQSTGYSVSHLSRVFAGETKPSIKCLIEVTQYLRMGIDEFLRKLDSGELFVQREKNC